MDNYTLRVIQDNHRMTYHQKNKFHKSKNNSGDYRNNVYSVRSSYKRAMYVKQVKVFSQLPFDTFRLAPAIASLHNS